MTAKRKSSQRKPEVPDTPQTSVDEFVAAFLKTPEAAAWAEQYIKEANSPTIRRNRKRAAARQSALMSFLNCLNDLPASQGLPDRFDIRWEKWLTRFEKEEIAKLPAKDRTDSRVGKWVKRAWVTTELNDSGDIVTGRFLFHDHCPSADTHPVPSVLVHHKGQWRMPKDQMLVTKSHPFVRAFCKSLPPLSDKVAVLRKMHWAMSLEGKIGSPEERLNEAALFLNDALRSDSNECLPDEKFIPYDQIPENNPLWGLINAAIGFGRMLQQQEIFGDGSVEKLLHHGVGQEQPSPQRESIAGLMEGYFQEHGSDATAMSLLKWVGGIRPYSDADAIQFPDKRYDTLRGIAWPAWNQHVRNIKSKK
ncbi:hypothetical protein HQ447_03365 [bacterium]|nr:hypothetical protein [bacterium]